jgi:hypothetical protein
MGGNANSRLLADECRQISVEIAATLMARYRFDKIKSGDVSQLIALLGKVGFAPKDRGSMNLPTDST